MLSGASTDKRPRSKGGGPVGGGEAVLGTLVVASPADGVDGAAVVASCARVARAQGPSTAHAASTASTTAPARRSGRRRRRPPCRTSLIARTPSAVDREPTFPDPPHPGTQRRAKGTRGAFPRP